MAANLKTIAEMAGVSTVTVSNVINGKYNKASKETIDKVQKIIDETHYQPNASARSLVSKQSHMIGVVLPNIGDDQIFSVSPYNTNILAYLEQYIRNRDYYMMFRCVNNIRDIVPVFSSWNVDGALLLSVFAHDAVEVQKALHIPAVFIDTHGDDSQLANVGIDDYKGGYLAGKHLVDNGHRRIAFVGPDTNFPGVMQERYRGFCDALAEKGIEFSREDFYETDTDFRKGLAVGERIGASEREYTAVAAMADILALGIMEGLRRAGKEIPDDVSVIGFDNLQMCQFSHPQLTSISQNLEEKARIAADYLFAMMLDEEPYSGSKSVEVELIERQSVKSLL